MRRNQVRLALAGLLIGGLLLGAGCANRNVEDFNSEQAASRVAQLQREAGKWVGALSSPSVGPLAAITLEISPGTEFKGGDGEQQVGLQGSIGIAPATGPSIRLGFQFGNYDFAGRTFRISTDVTRPDGSHGLIQVSGKFTDELVAGTIWASGFDTYGASFSARRNGSVPAASGLASGLSAAGRLAPSSSTYVAEISNLNPLDTGHPTEPVTLRVLAIRGSDQRFLAYFEPVSYVDLALTLGYTGDGSIPADTLRTVIYRNAEFDPITGQLTGRSDGQSTLNELLCNDDGASGWNCTLHGPSRLNGGLGIHFRPEGR